MLLLKRGKLVIGRLVDDHMVLDPAHLALAGLGFQEAASVLDYLKRLSIGNQSDSIRYSSNPVSQIGLLGHYIDHLRLGVFAQTIATGQRGDQSNAYYGAKQKTRGRRGEGATKQQTYERQGLPVTIRPDFPSRCTTEFTRERLFLIKDPLSYTRKTLFPSSSVMTLTGNSPGVVRSRKLTSPAVRKKNPVAPLRVVRSGSDVTIQQYATFVVRNIPNGIGMLQSDT